MRSGTGGKRKQERRGMSEDEIDEIREAFNLFDHNGNGRIDPS